MSPKQLVIGILVGAFTSSATGYVVFGLLMTLAVGGRARPLTTRAE